MPFLNASSRTTGAPVINRAPQRGATALEFTLAFPLYFFLFYGIISYGFVFLAKMSLQHAAEEGARAALHYAVFDPAIATELQTRAIKARETATTQASWMKHANTEVGICNTLVTSSCSDNMIDETCSFSTTYTSRCQVIVTVSYDYQANPIIPPLLSFLLPSKLKGQASVRLDGRALTTR